MSLYIYIYVYVLPSICLIPSQTGTGDAEILIDQYAKIKPGNALSKYLDRLHEISQLPTCDRPNRGKTNGLEGYVEAWKQEACSPDQSFAHLQRQWVYENYMIPSNRYAAQNGVNSALGRAIFYGTKKKKTCI